jgi:hypothetical protein
MSIVLVALPSEALTSFGCDKSENVGHIGRIHNQKGARPVAQDRGMVYASFIHTVTRPIDGIPDPHYHIHTYVFNATFDSEEERWKAGEFGGLKREATFFLLYN